MNELFDGPSISIYDLGFFDENEDRIYLGTFEAPYDKWNGNPIEISSWKEVAKLIEDISDGKISVENGDSIRTAEFDTYESEYDPGTRRSYRIDWIEGMRRLMEIIA